MTEIPPDPGPITPGNPTAPPPYPEIVPDRSPDEAPQTAPTPQEDETGRPHDWAVGEASSAVSR
jgi:hypothetical protein